MTNQQKLIVAGLFFVVISIFAAAGCMGLIFMRTSAPEPVASLAAVTQPPPSPVPSFTPSSTATPPQPATATPTQMALPTPISTRVITVTPTATPRPTPINCIYDIGDFEITGIITNEQVEDYLRETIPLDHLDRCLRIRYVPKAHGSHDAPASGRFIPVIRQISVYPVEGVSLTAGDILDTLTHEVGHNVHFNMRIDNLELADQWKALYRQDLGFVTDYARTNEFEDFAESYWTYVRHPQNLLVSSPVKYEFMRVEVFAGQEYPR